MASKGIFRLIHLHMEAAETLTGAIVVNHQIVETQHSGLGVHHFRDHSAKLGGRRLTKQRADGLLGKTHRTI